MGHYYYKLFSIVIMRLDDRTYSVPIRGTFVVNNKEALVIRMKRGENYKWIANYLFANPCITAGSCRRALLLWRGYNINDRSRGQYASYFYDRWSYQWYYEKYWSFFNKGNNKIMQLTPLGMSLFDEELQFRIKNWNRTPRGLDKVVIDNQVITSFLENRSLEELEYHHNSRKI